LQQNLDAMRLKLDNDDRAVIARLRKDQRIVNVAWALAWDKPRS
jgi:2,5-diketo-D-gluconate reductase B